jgi:PAS domain S-box-containing protein
MSQYPTAEQIFVGDSESARLMRSLDWSQTSLGKPSSWSQSLKTVLSILLTSQHPIFLWWGQDLIQFYNDAYRPILGTTKHPQAMGQQGQECWQEIWPVIEPMIEAVRQRGEATRIQDGLLLLERNGYLEECYFNYAYSPVRDETGEVGGVFCACDETTKRVLGERQLKTLRELAALPLETKTLKEACQLSMSVIAKNPADLPFALLYLMDETGESAQLMGTAGIDPGLSASPETLQIATHGWNLSQVSLMGQPEPITDLTTRFDVLPNTFWNVPPQSAIAMPLNQSGQQQVAGFLILAVSPRRAFDDEYRGFFDVVASQVETAITNARAYEEERKRIEALAELDRAKTVFFSNISHEFRTPLTLMLSPLAETLTHLDGIIPSQAHEQLQLVQRNGKRLLKLVNSLLDFSRIEAGRVQVCYEPIDLSGYTAELASAFHSLITQAGLSLIVECPPLPEAICVDRDMWEKIVLNLLSNAFKFTFAGTISIRLQWIGSQVKLSVTDTGIGIPPEELPHLFERFHRVENSQGRSYEGSGIGLSLVQELVKLQGGTIQVSSVLGEGSCFTVLIPTTLAAVPEKTINPSCTLASPTLDAIPYVEEARRWLPEYNLEPSLIDFESDQRSFLSTTHFVNQPDSSNSQCSNFKVLLADDNADMRHYIQRLLSGSYTVETTTDGVAALESIQSSRPDLVLTDVMMPRMDGFELLRSLRANTATQDIPIILLSARAGEEARIEGLEAGADDYLIKPFSARELIARVEATLKLAQLRRTARDREQELQNETQRVTAKLDQVMSNLRDGFVTFDRNWRYTYINNRLLEILHLPREAVIGRYAWDVLPHQVGIEFYDQLNRAMYEQVEVQFEFYYEMVNSWVEHRVYPTTEGVAILMADVSDRKQVEIALQESEERLRVAQFGAKTGTWDWDVVAGNIFWSPEYYALFGIDPTTPSTYENWLDTVIEEDRATADQTVRDTLQQQQTHLDFEFRSCHPTEGIRWFSCRGQVFYDSNRQPKRAIGIAIDITDRKQTEEALHRSEEQSRMILESITDAFIALDENWRYIYVNSTAEELLFRPPGYLVGTNIWEEYPGLIGSEFEQLYRRVAEEGVADSATLFYPDHNRWYEVRVYPVTNGITIYCSNVTHRKQMETELEERNLELDRFVYIVSHDLKAPLRGIANLSQWIEEDITESLSEDTRQQMDLLRDRVHRMEAMISGLLDYARAGRTDGMIETVAVEELLAEVIDSIAPPPTFQIAIAPEMPTLFTKRLLLSQVFSNLISNGIKHHDRPDGSIQISGQDQGEFYEFAVADDGPGIAPEYHDKIFMIFQAVNPQKNVDSSGVGLSIVKKIVETEEGTIRLESNIGEGTTFYFTWPKGAPSTLAEVSD